MEAEETPVAEATPEKVAEKPAEATPTPAPAAVEATPTPTPKVEEAKEEKTEVKPAAESKPDGDTPTPTNNKDNNKGNNKKGQKRKRGDDEPFQVTEDEPEIATDFMCLDWQNSDLTLKINKETFVAAEPFYSQAWGYIFSSARATHGFKAGKIAFSVKWTGNMEVKLDEVKEPHELRVGFSTNDCNLQVKKRVKLYYSHTFFKNFRESNDLLKKLLEFISRK